MWDLAVADLDQDGNDDIVTLELLADIFRLRLLNNKFHCDDTSWDTCVANLIQKIRDPVKITQFRPIAIAPVPAAGAS